MIVFCTSYIAAMDSSSTLCSALRKTFNNLGDQVTKETIDGHPYLKKCFSGHPFTLKEQERLFEFMGGFILGAQDAINKIEKK